MGSQAPTGNLGVLCPASPAPHGRGSQREEFAEGKGKDSSGDFAVGFCCWGAVMTRGSLPHRQARGAAGGRRDRLQELHQENPVSTSQLLLPTGLGHSGGCHVLLTSTQMSLPCYGPRPCRLSCARPHALAHAGRGTPEPVFTPKPALLQLMPGWFRPRSDSPREVKKEESCFWVLCQPS